MKIKRLIGYFIFILIMFFGGLSLTSCKNDVSENCVHEYDTTYKFNKKEHYRICKICHKKLNYNVHQLKDVDTDYCAENGKKTIKTKCSICDYYELREVDIDVNKNRELYNQLKNECNDALQGYDGSNYTTFSMSTKQGKNYIELLKLNVDEEEKYICIKEFNGLFYETLVFQEEEDKMFQYYTYEGTINVTRNYLEDYSFEELVGEKVDVPLDEFTVSDIDMTELEIEYDGSKYKLTMYLKNAVSEDELNTLVKEFEDNGIKIKDIEHSKVVISYSFKSGFIRVDVDYYYQLDDGSEEKTLSTGSRVQLDFNSFRKIDFYNGSYSVNVPQSIEETTRTNDYEKVIGNGEGYYRFELPKGAYVLKKVSEVAIYDEHKKLLKKQSLEKIYYDDGSYCETLIVEIEEDGKYYFELKPIKSDSYIAMKIYKIPCELIKPKNNVKYTRVEIAGKINESGDLNAYQIDLKEGEVAEVTVMMLEQINSTTVLYPNNSTQEYNAIEFSYSSTEIYVTFEITKDQYFYIFCNRVRSYKFTIRVAKK